MTHLKKKWLVLLASASLLASCGNPEAKSSQEGSIPSESSNIVPPSSSEDIYDHTELEPLSDISKNISYSTSGYLGDISVGMSLAHQSDYPIVFTLSDNPSGTARVYSDNENVLTASSDASGSSWTLHTHKAGEAHLIIEDGDHILHFRRHIEVKPKLSLEDIKKTVYEVDHWDVNLAFSSFFGNMQLYFFKDGTADINGTESGGVTFNHLKFDYTYAPTYTEAAEDLDHWYIFQVTNWTEQSLVVTYFAVWETGDTLHLHTTQSLLGIFNPAEVE